MTQANPPPASPPPPRARRRHPVLKVFLWATGALLVLLVVLIVFLPRILSTSAARGPMLGVLESRLGVPVEAEDLRLSWNGPQVVEGLRLSEPAGFPPDEDLLQVRNATVDAGLLGLLWKSGPLRVTVTEPVARVRRNREGRFNFEAIFPRKPKEETPPQSRKDGGGEVPRVTREVFLDLKDGQLFYTDELLDTASRLAGVGIHLNLEKEKGDLKAQASLEPAGQGAPGKVSLVGTMRGFAQARSLKELELNVQGTVEGLDLRPYRGLFEELFKLTPPERPVEGRFSLVTEAGALRAKSGVELGFAGIQEATLEMPIEPGGAAATIRVPYTLELGGALAALGSHSGLPPGTELAGKVQGVLSATGPLSLEALAQKGSAALAGLAVALETTARDVVVRLPAAKAQPGGEGAPAERPQAITEKEIKLVFRGTTGETPRDLKIERAEVTAESVRGDLSGSLRAAREGKDAVAASDLDLAANLDLGLPAIVSRLAGRLPYRVEAGPGARARVTGLVVKGRVGGAQPLVQTLNGEGKLELTGPVEAHGVKVEKAQSSVHLEGGQLRLEETSAAVNGGTLSVKEAALGLVGEAPAYRLEMQAEDVDANYDLASLLAYVAPILSMEGQKAELSGKINGGLNVAGQGFRTPDLQKSLKGAGELHLREGRLSASRFLNELSSLLGGSLDQLQFADLSSSFNIGEGRIVCDNVTLTGKEGSKVRKLGLKGTTYVDGKIDYGVELSVLEEAIGDKKIRAILEQAKKFLKKDTLPLRLGGTLAQPRLSLDAKLQLPGIEDLPGLPGIPGLPGLKDLQLPPLPGGLKPSSAEPKR